MIITAISSVLFVAALSSIWWGRYRDGVKDEHARCMALVEAFFKDPMMSDGELLAAIERGEPEAGK